MHENMCIMCAFGAAVIAYFVIYHSNFTKNIKKETYKDPIWTQPAKIYQDYYTRSGGSIYGTPDKGWNMFSGINSNERAY